MLLPARAGGAPVGRLSALHGAPPPPPPPPLRHRPRAVIGGRRRATAAVRARADFKQQASEAPLPPPPPRAEAEGHPRHERTVTGATATAPPPPAPPPQTHSGGRRQAAAAAAGPVSKGRRVVRGGCDDPSTWDREREKRRTVCARDVAVALVLGGGASDRRLFPLTQRRALPAVPVGGAYRLIDVPLSNLIAGSINKIFVLTQYNSQSLTRYISRTYGVGHGVPLGGDGFIEVLATSQTPEASRWSEGNADAVRLCAWLLDSPKLRHIHHVLVLPADQLYVADLEALVDAHWMSNSALTVVTHAAQEEQVADLGVVQVDPLSGELLDHAEKPRGEELQRFRLPPGLPASVASGAPFLASCGIYVFDKQFLLSLLRDHPRAQSFGADVLPLAFPALRRRAAQHAANVAAYEREVAAWEAAAAAARAAAGGGGGGGEKAPPRPRLQHLRHKATTWRLHGFWADVGGSVAAFRTANLQALLPGGILDVAVHGGQLLAGGAARLPPTLLCGSSVAGCAIGPGGRIQGATLRGCVVGPRAVIGRGAVVSESVLMGADYYEGEGLDDPAAAAEAEARERGDAPAVPPMGIGEGCVVQGAIVDKNVRMGRNCLVANRAGVWEATDRVGVGLCVREGVPVVTKSAILYDGTEL